MVRCDDGILSYCVGDMCLELLLDQPVNCCLCRRDASDTQEGGEEGSHIDEGTATSKHENEKVSQSGTEDSDDR